MNYCTTITAMLIFAASMASASGDGPAKSALEFKPISAATAGTPEGRSRTVERKRELEAKLEKSITGLSFKETPLSEVIDELGHRTGITFRFDERALIDHGIDSGQEISLSIKKSPVSVRDVVRIMIRPMDLALLNDSGVGVITTQTEADDILENRVYNVRDLIEDAVMRRGLDNSPSPYGGISKSEEPQCVEFPPTEDLIRVIYAASGHPWIEIDGVGGTIKHFDGLLIISQTEACHREIADLLEQLRGAGKLLKWSDGIPKQATAEERAAHEKYNAEIEERAKQKSSDANSNDP
ncbi:hypothetical protein [Stratiformator vulcanicus]|uniref:Uncharacterized protein n=1 Tax=Stratiformator vulcanicus TaxID=2527980 RepID=A0A517QXZ3_9PLAN|nr:hypothetical protein [Stratiformator vulcanicus]QDT36473.1 hypothetical protein Pan189_08300 [Stratiformator vulcanicus]